MDPYHRRARRASLIRSFISLSLVAVALAAAAMPVFAQPRVLAERAAPAASVTDPRPAR